MRNEEEGLSKTGRGRCAPPHCSAAGAQVEVFKIPFDVQAPQDLRRRLHATRWPDAVASASMNAGQQRFLRRFIAYWAEDYDWRARVATLNQLPHYRAAIGGLGIHFLHFTANRPAAGPVLLVNDWPSSFVEYLRLVPQLVNGEPAFDVVVPALPGCGYSDWPTGALALAPHHACAALMRTLGYERYFVAGSDHGRAVATSIALHHGKHVIGLHLATRGEPPRHADEPPGPSEDHGRDGHGTIAARRQPWHRFVHGSPLETLAAALTDSPAGLARFMLDTLRCWPDRTADGVGFPFEMLADNLSISWMTKTIPCHWSDGPPRMRVADEDYVYVPCAIALWAKELNGSARALADRLYNVRRFSVFGQGARFPAWEEPELYASDLRHFAASLAR